jgi:HTH domain
VVEIDRMIAELEQARAVTSERAEALQAELDTQRDQLRRLDAMLVAGSGGKGKGRRKRKAATHPGNASRATMAKVIAAIRSGSPDLRARPEIPGTTFTAPQLAKVAGVSESTVHRAIRSLRDDGTLREAGSIPTKGPHPAPVYEVVATNGGHLPGVPA